MAQGDRIYMADKTTQDKILANTNAILASVETEDGKHKNVKRYGIKINKLDSNPSTRVSYIYDAVGLSPASMNFGSQSFDYGDWGDVWFIKNNYPCMLNYDGTEAYKLDPDDYTQKEGGGTSDVANTSFGGNAMAVMPTVWLSQYEVGNYQYIIACEEQYDESYHAYAHTREDGSIMEKLYLSMFKGSYDNSRLRSISGQQPMYNQSATTEISRATANGTGWYTKTWSQRNLIACLLAIIFKTDNGQAALGNGNLNYQESASPTYGMLQTGTLNDKGQFWGMNDNTHQVKAFHIEAVWGDQWDRTAGLMLKNGTVHVKMTPPYNTTADGYFDTGIVMGGTSGGYIRESVSDWFGRIPKTMDGSSSTYQCDGGWFNNGATTYALVGGSCNDGSKCGPWALYLTNGPGTANWNFGASLSFEQPSAA